MKSSKPNDWKQFIDFQVKTIKSQDTRANTLKNLNKQMYKSIIDAQVQYKSSLRQNELKAKEQEALDLYKSLNDYEQFKTSQKNLNRLTQNSLFNDYASQVNTRHKTLQENKAKEKELEKSLINANHITMEKAKNLEILKKTQRISAFNEYLDSKYYENLKKQEEKTQEKLKDCQLLNESRESFYKNQEEYYNKLANIEQKQKLYQESYKPVQNNESLRSRSRSLVISKWEEESEQKKLAVEAVKNEERKKMIKSGAQGLINQINESNYRKLQERTQIDSEKQISDLNIIHNDLKLGQNRAFNQEFKGNYKRYLIEQIGQKEQERFRENLLNQKEKGINREVIERYSNDQEFEFKAIPGLHRSQSVARCESRLSSDSRTDDLRRTMKVVEKGFEGSFYSEKCSYSSQVDLRRHDPIVNPIGYSFDSNRSFRRGRGLSTLN